MSPVWVNTTLRKENFEKGNFTVIACFFLVSLVIIIIKITIIIIIIIIATIIIIKKNRSYAQNVVFDVQKRGPSCPNWGQGGGFR